MVESERKSSPMLVVDALLVLGLVAVLVVAGAAYSTRFQRASRAPDGVGSRELAHAMRLLDQVRAVDDAIPQLPSSLRADVDRAVTTYYKEIGR